MYGAARTPRSVAINPRHPQFELAECLSRDWHGGDPFRTAFFNALSLTFPKGEKFFIDSVRAFQRDITDAKLAQDIRGFIGQEAIHSREHQQMNDMLAHERGYDVDKIDARLDRDTQWAMDNLSALTRLAFTVATEHITAILGHQLLTNPAWLDGADPRMAQLWRWHAVEEIEHKAVAFDTFLASGGSRKALRTGLRVETWSLFSHVRAGIYLMLKKDGLHLSPKVWIDGAKWLFGDDGILRKAIPAWREFMREDFHPWNTDNRALIERWIASAA
jgi:uncharacterized protein